MHRWLDLDTQELNPGRDESAQGVTFRVFLSPYDVPDAVRGYWEKKKFIVEFRYLGSEPTIADTQGVVKLVTGKNSGRLHAIHIDTLQLGTDQIDVVLLKSLDREADDGRSFQMAKHILEGQGSSVLQDLRTKSGS